MKLSICPRCELNYITESEKYCKVCLQEMHSRSRNDEIELCSVCNEEPALPGRDVCLNCLREMGGSLGTTHSTDTDNDGTMDSGTLGGMDSVVTMDEIIPEIEDELSNHDFAESDDEHISLESIREEEDEEDDDEDTESDER